MLVSRFHLIEQCPTDSVALTARNYEDVLNVADCRVVGDRSNYSDQLAVFVTSTDDEWGVVERLAQRERVSGVCGPAN